MSRSLFHQFLAFLGVGVIATLLHYAVLLVMVELFAIIPVVSSTAGAISGALISYYLNRNYTFRSQADHRKTAPKFFLVAGLTVVANSALMGVFTIWLQWPYLPAQVLTTGLLVILTFGLNKFWSFRP